MVLIAAAWATNATARHQNRPSRTAARTGTVARVDYTAFYYFYRAP